MTRFRNDLIKLISVHATRTQVYSYFQKQYEVDKGRVNRVLSREGVDFPPYLAHEYTDERHEALEIIHKLPVKPPAPDPHADRKRYLQELSLT